MLHLKFPQHPTLVEPGISNEFFEYANNWLGFLLFTKKQILPVRANMQHFELNDNC